MTSTISYKNILAVAIPMMVGGLSINIVTLTDTIFLSRLGEMELGAAGNGGIFYFIFAFVGMGFTTGLQIILGRRNGERRYKEIGSHLTHAIYFVIGFSLLLYLVFFFLAPHILRFVVESDAIYTGVMRFLNIRAWALPVTLLNFTMVALFVGITKTRVIALAMPITAMLNIFLDYSLIFGKMGFPRMGIEGAALASNISEFTGFAILLGYALLKLPRSKYALFDTFGFKPQLIRSQVNVSYPLMIQNFLTLGAWFTFFAILENIGERELAISHIVRSMYMFMMIPVFSLGDATNTLVSNLLGEQKGDQIFVLLKRVLVLGLGVSLIVLTVNFSFPNQLIGIYTEDVSLIYDARSTFFIVTVAMLFFTVGLLFFRALTGTGRTKLSLRVEIWAIVIYLAYAFVVAKGLEGSLEWTWSSEFVYFSLISLFSLYFLRKKVWEGQSI